MNSLHVARATALGSRPFQIRTVTAGVAPKSLADLGAIESALEFLQRARTAFEDQEYVVQSVRLATTPLSEYVGTTSLREALPHLQRLDATTAAADALLSIGPVLGRDRYDPELAPWIVELCRQTRNLYCSVAVASPDGGSHHLAARVAAEAILGLAQIGNSGEENFRFAAAANVPPGTPFFPAAHHAGETPGFSLGLESAGLVAEAFAAAESPADATARLRTRLQAELEPLQRIAEELAAETEIRFLGIDVSPAPSLEASIGGAVESLTGVPFGASATLTACAAITGALQELELSCCGYSGVMLPVLEDRVLARRAGERRFGVRDLLLFSSVCGTGLDVVPLPGDTSVEPLAALIGDLATLATRLGKPLSARLLPVPEKKAHEIVRFENPHFTDCAVLPLDAAAGLGRRS